MTIRELANTCKKNNIDCENCSHIDECKVLTNKLEDISPIGLIELIDNNEEI